MHDLFAEISAMRIERDGTITVTFTDGRSATDNLGREPFKPTSMIDSSTHLPQSSQLHLRTTREGHDIVAERGCRAQPGRRTAPGRRRSPTTGWAGPGVPCTRGTGISESRTRSIPNLPDGSMRLSTRSQIPNEARPQP